MNSSRQTYSSIILNDHTSSYLDDNSFGKPLVFIGNLQLIPRQQTCIIVLEATKHEVGKPFLIILAKIKSYLHIVLGLTFFDLSICFCLLRYKGFKD